MYNKVRHFLQNMTFVTILTGTALVVNVIKQAQSNSFNKTINAISRRVDE